MDGNKEESSNFYEILGLKKECSEAELKNAYKKLALRWHPDRCSSSGNLKYVEEAKKKFQAVQEAYSVLSDANKRFMYDVGIHDNDKDDTDGMADFLNEMATMMRQNKPSENVKTNFEELKDLFEEMFQSDIESTKSINTCPSLFSSCGESSNFINKRVSREMSTSTFEFEDSSNFRMSVQGFCLGAGNTDDTKRGGCVRERRGTKHGHKHKSSQNGFSSIRA